MLPVGSMGKALVGVWGLCRPEGHAPSGVHGQSSGGGLGSMSSRRPCSQWGLWAKLWWGSGVWGLCRPEADDSFL